MDNEIPFDGKRMRVVSTANVGIVDQDTLFTFEQRGRAVSAHYQGGKVRLGYLIGLHSSSHLDFRYIQIDTDDHLDSGFSKCELHRLPDGRLRLLEHFQWESREGSGTNVFEEER
jgi:hypothetical protein